MTAIGEHGDNKSEPPSLRIIGRPYDDDSPLTLSEMSQILCDFNSLIVLAAFNSDKNIMFRERFPNYGDEDLRLVSLERAHQDAHDVRIASLQYASPIDLVLYTISSGSGLGILYSVLRLWSRALDVAKKHSDTQLHITKNEIIREELLASVGLSDKKRRRFLKRLLTAKDADDQLRVIIDQASSGLRQIETIEINRG